MTVLHIYISGDQHFIICCCGRAPAVIYCKSSNRKQNVSNECEFKAYVKTMLTVHYIKWLSILALSVVCSCFKHSVSETGSQLCVSGPPEEGCTQMDMCDKASKYNY